MPGAALTVYERERIAPIVPPGGSLVSRTAPSSRDADLCRMVWRSSDNVGAATTYRASRAQREIDRRAEPGGQGTAVWSGEQQWVLT